MVMEKLFCFNFSGNRNSIPYTYAILSTVPTANSPSTNRRGSQTRQEGQSNPASPRQGQGNTGTIPRPVPVVPQPGTPTSSFGSPQGATALSPSSLQANPGSGLRRRQRPTTLEVSELNPLAHPWSPRSPPHIMTRSQARELAQLSYSRGPPSYGSTSPSRAERAATVSPQERLQVLRESLTYSPPPDSIAVNIPSRRLSNNRRVEQVELQPAPSSPGTPRRSQSNQINELVDNQIHNLRRINSETITVTTGSMESIAQGGRFTRTAKWLGGKIKRAPGVMARGAKKSFLAQMEAMSHGRWYWNAVKTAAKFITVVIAFVYVGRAFECIESGSEYSFLTCTFYSEKSLQADKIRKMNETMGGNYKTEEQRNEAFQNRTDMMFQGMWNVSKALQTDVADLKDLYWNTKQAHPDSDVHFGHFSADGSVKVFDTLGNEVHVPLSFLPKISPKEIAKEANTSVEEFYTVFRILSECSYSADELMTATMYNDYERYKGWTRILRATQSRIQKLSRTAPDMRTIDHKAWEEMIFNCRLPFTLPDEFLKDDLARVFTTSRATRYRELPRTYDPPRFRRSLNIQPYDDDDDVLGDHEITDEVVAKLNRGEMAFMTREEDEAIRNMTDPTGWTEFTSTPYTNTTKWIEAQPILPYQPPQPTWYDKLDVNQLIIVALAILPSVFLFGLLFALIRALNKVAASNRQRDNRRERAETARSDAASDDIMLTPQN